MRRPPAVENPPEDEQLSPPDHGVPAASTPAVPVQRDVLTAASGYPSTTGTRMPFKFTPATIKALATLVQVLDQHRFGAVMLILVMITAGALMVVPQLPALLAWQW
jgi:hypothetical protein